MPTCMTVEQRGFTLLEVLMVLFIIGLSLGAVLSLGLVAPERDQAARLERFDREYRTMAQAAVLEGRTFGLDFQVCAESQALCWRWLEPDGNDWQPLREWPAELDSGGGEGFAGSDFELRIDSIVYVPELATAGAAGTGKSEAFVYPTRESTAIALRLRDPSGDEAHWQVDAMGRSGSHAAQPPP